MPTVSLYNNDTPISHRFTNLIRQSSLSNLSYRANKNTKTYGYSEDIQRILSSAHTIGIEDLKYALHMNKSPLTSSLSDQPGYSRRTSEVDDYYHQYKRKPSSGSVDTTDSGIDISSIKKASHTKSILPKDESEIDRMVSQHYILRTAFDSDFSAPVSSLINHKKKAKKSPVVVLDVGCGAGTWTMEMAVQFPHATFIGIEKAPLFPRDIKPRNCNFMIFDTSDISYRLPFEDNSIDYIFQRDANWELAGSAWVPLVQEFYRILKPGGWIELVEQDIETQSSSSDEGFLIDKIIDILSSHQHDPFISKRLSSILAVVGFRSIKSDFQSIPLGWGYSKCSRNKAQSICSEYARASAMQHLLLLKSLRPWFTQDGQKSKSKFDSCVNKLLADWHQARSYVNWHKSIGQKPYS
ncbi:hypothetical protein RMCBS344292_06526 [Rhizopus microsporus]|nr:hypothetical protein RMCBS344292_06526 [Rhizopus microsporus]